MVSQRRIWAKALAEFCCLWPRGCAVPGWGMAGLRQWNSRRTSDCSTGWRWRCWGFWQTRAAGPPGNMFPILQFHWHLFHAQLAWWWRRMSPRKAGLAWCPLVPEWAQLTRFLPSVKSAVFWIQVGAWGCLATQARIVLFSLLEIPQVDCISKQEAALSMPASLGQAGWQGARPAPGTPGRLAISGGACRD